MPRKSVSSPEPKPQTELRVSREEAKSRLQERIQKGKELKQTQINSRDVLEAVQNEYNKWDSYNIQLMKHVFTTAELADEYSQWVGKAPILRHSEPSLAEKAANLQERIDGKTHRIESIVERLELIPLTRTFHENPPTAGSKVSIRTMTNNVFLVHGRNEVWRETVARFLEHLDLRVTILHEQPNRGRTIIEKFEAHSQEAGFAVILLTGDDLGGLKGQDPSTYQLRARQNVILELGFFCSVLTRSRVCALYEDGVEIPSDFHGVLFIRLDSDWKFSLAREMKVAGLPIDLNKIM